ncbi:MAG TPA: TonB-dependent receptor plug domain-containing protein, partial [Thermoanaerobaculia bacterium]|nr:TonB-dependent receptor plug domain-containing protein [Thermoanaerobaculia bacterium]
MLFLSLAALPAGAQEEPPPQKAQEPVQDEITVTATRTEQRLGETAASVVVLSAEEVASTAAQTVDDALRQVPGFSLFRRSGSRYANPTAQRHPLRG